jgi:hypothetical protein
MIIEIKYTQKIWNLFMRFIDVSQLSQVSPIVISLGVLLSYSITCPTFSYVGQATPCWFHFYYN